MKLAQSEIDILKTYFENNNHFINLIEMNYQSVNQSPEFNNREIKEKIDKIRMILLGELSVICDFGNNVLNLIDTGESDKLRDYIETFDPEM